MPQHPPSPSGTLAAGAEFLVEPPVQGEPLVAEPPLPDAPPLPFLPRKSVVTADLSDVHLSVEPEGVPRTWRQWRRQTLKPGIGFGSSLFVHTLAVVILALVVLGDDKEPRRLALVVGPADSLDPDEILPPVSVPDVSILAEQPAAVDAMNAEAQMPDAPNIPSPFAAPVVEPTVNRIDLSQAATISALLAENNLPVGGGFEGRTPQERARLAAERGGSPESESAVELALEWLAAHQREDGGWRLKHQEGECQGRCGNPGTIDTSTGATALALLPFLGAGYTHQSGKHKEVVERGLYYLTGRMIDTQHGGDLQEGTMYAQGLATLALCEAYGMTGDEELQFYAQRAADFIVTAQHPRGGWRYVPGAPGDTTVTGWQIMALKSARLAHLYVPSHVTENAKSFLDSVQDSDGAFYGYLQPGKEPGATAVGLLMRMYLGWVRNDQQVGRGAMYLASLGPSKTDMYFNYYATQVMHHRGTSEWDRWNRKMRDYLIETQSRSGHETGSWHFPDRHGTVGGRLYTTALCTMILEVYYRYMPLYGEEAVEDAF